MNDKLRADSHYLFLALALVAVCMLCVLGLPVFDRAAAQNSTAKFNGKIAFVTNRNGPPGEIYVMNPDGSNQQNITNSPASEMRPAFSHDGKKIAFVKDFKGIYLMNPDGTGQTTVFDLTPAWSLDGTRIAFTSRRDDNFEVYVMNADGSNQARLTNNPEQDSDAKWSPDGTKIVFMSSHTGGGRFGEIYTMNPDGTDQ